MTVSGEHGHKSSAHIKRGEILDEMSKCQFLKKGYGHDGESVTKCTVGQSGLDFDLQTGDIAANRSISLGKVEFSFI